MIAFACSHCAQKQQVEDDLAGKETACAHCGQSTFVPKMSEVPLPPGAVAPPAVPPYERTHVEAPTPPPGTGPVLGRTGEPSAPLVKVSTVPGAGEVKAPFDETQVWATQSHSGSDPAQATQDQDQDDQEKLDFLSPPQGPGEMGRIGSYRVLKILGTGGMGVVFQAEDIVLKRVVAIKAMLPEIAAKPSNRQRFLREAQATAAIEHDHIVTIYQVGEHQNVPFLVMQFLQGEPLDERLHREGKLPIPVVLRIGRETAEALAAAHGRGLIHRDIKPANIWLEGSRGRVKILDFGLARATAENSHLTQSGMILGTPAFMAPEQARGRGVDHRSDLFSLGCVMYRMCAGQLPFQGTDTLGMLVALVSENPRPLQELQPQAPPELVDLVMRLLSKNPAGRPSTAQAVVEAIEAIEAIHNGRAFGKKPEPVAPLAPPKQQPSFEGIPGLMGFDTGHSGSEVLELGDLDVGFEEGEESEGAALGSDTSSEAVEVAEVEEPSLPLDRLGELAGQAFGHFLLERVLGYGQTGVVFLALDQKKDRQVALKILSSEFPAKDSEKNHFIRAMQTMLPVRHPNIVNLYGVGKSGPYCWISLEYVDGESLTQTIERLALAKKIDWRRAFRMTVFMGRALEFAGRNHLSHLNITPQNILWCSGERLAKLSDLMYAQALEGSQLQELSQENKRLYELPYLSPEQLEGDAYVDDVSDLYSLGAVTYAFLTGRPPFQGISPEETLEQIRDSEPVRPSKFQRGIPSEFEWVVLTMLARDRKYRFQNPSELLTYLERIALEQGVKI